MSVDIQHFIASEPTLDAIVAYRLPETLEQRVEELLEKNREESLTPDEREEMNEFLAVDHMMILAKAETRLLLLLLHAACNKQKMGRKGKVNCVFPGFSW